MEPVLAGPHRLSEGGATTYPGEQTAAPVATRGRVARRARALATEVVRLTQTKRFWSRGCDLPMDDVTRQPTLARPRCR